MVNKAVLVNITSVTRFNEPHKLVSQAGWAARSQFNSQ